MVPPPAVKVPKAAARLKELLGSQLAPDMSFETFKSAVPGNEINIIKTTMRQHMDKEQKEKFSVCSKEEMTRWISQYLLDPISGIQKGWNEIVVSKIDTTLQEDEWLYESQLADRLKDSALTKILIDAKDFDDRLSEHPSAAAAGYKQYNYTRYLRRHETQLKDTAGCRTENDLKPDEYTAAASHMRDNYGQPASKKQRTTTKKEKEPESAESIALRQAKSNLASSCRKAKGMCDRMRAECEEWKKQIQNGDRPRLPTGYGGPLGGQSCCCDEIG